MAYLITTQYQIADELKTVRIERAGNHFSAWIGDQTYRIEVENLDRVTLAFRIDGKPYRAYIEQDKTNRYVAFEAVVYTFAKADNNAGSTRRKTARTGENTLAAVMPGQVVKVLVSEGENVKRGQPLMVLEAMKMEIRVTAPGDGRVVKLLCHAGEIVERGQRLLEFVAG
jgi:3-methylcrotonyl-CoA carboxylase alpha subunit